MGRTAEVFIFEENFVFTTCVAVKRVEGDRVALKNTPLLSKFAILGKKAYLKYSTFVLPVKVVGKSDEEVIFTLPSVSPERPVGDRRSARVKPSPDHPVKLFIEDEEQEVEDVSEGGFSIILRDVSRLERYIKGEVEVRMNFPVEGEEVRGTARLVNVREQPDGSVKLGFEFFSEDADMVKVRFYVYSRVREILKE